MDVRLVYCMIRHRTQCGGQLKKEQRHVLNTWQILSLLLPIRVSDCEENFWILRRGSICRFSTNCQAAVVAYLVSTDSLIPIQLSRFPSLQFSRTSRPVGQCGQELRDSANKKYDIDERVKKGLSLITKRNVTPSFNSKNRQHSRHKVVSNRDHH